MLTCTESATLLAAAAAATEETEGGHFGVEDVPRLDGGGRVVGVVGGKEARRFFAGSGVIEKSLHGMATSGKMNPNTASKQVRKGVNR